MTMPTEVGAMLRLSGREQFTADAKMASESVEQIGAMAEEASTLADASAKRFGIFGARVKEAAMSATKSMGVVGAEAGSMFGEGFYRDAVGRLHDSQGKFVSAGRLAGMGITEGAEESTAELGPSIGARAKAGMAAAGRSAGRTFGSKMSETAKEYVKTIAGTFIAFFAAEKIMETGKEAFSLANEAVKANQQTTAALKSTKDASGETSGSIENLSKHMEKFTGQSHLANQGILNLLLTFPMIKKGGGIFKQAAEESANLAARLGTSQQSATKMVGKALQDGTSGLTALSRVGIKFSASQTAVLTTLEATGHTARAQKIILDALQARVGGAAQAAITPTEKLHVAWEDFEETLGQKAMPTVNKLVVWLTQKGIPGLTKFGGWLDRNKNSVKHVAEGIAALLIVMKLYTAYSKVMAVVTALSSAEFTGLDVAMDANPIGAVIIGIAALAAGLIYAYKHCKTFRDIVQDAMKVLGPAFDFVKAHWQLFALAFIAAFAPMFVPVVLFIKYFGKIKAAFMDVYDWVKAHWRLLASIITAPILGPTVLILTHLHAIVHFVENMGSRIKNGAVGMFDGVKDAFKAALNWIVDAWDSLKFTVPGFHHLGISFGGFSLAVPQIPEFKANGGPVQAGQSYIVGERGKELFRPTMNGVIIPNTRLGDAVRGGDGADSMPRARPAMAAPRIASADTISSTMLAGPDGDLYITLEVDGKKLAEVVYKDIRKKDARS